MVHSSNVKLRSSVPVKSVPSHCTGSRHVARTPLNCWATSDLTLNLKMEPSLADTERCCSSLPTARLVQAQDMPAC